MCSLEEYFLESLKSNYDAVIEIPQNKFETNIRPVHSQLVSLFSQNNYLDVWFRDISVIDLPIDKNEQIVQLLPSEEYVNRIIPDLEYPSCDFVNRTFGQENRKGKIQPENLNHALFQRAKSIRPSLRVNDFEKTLKAVVLLQGTTRNGASIVLRILGFKPFVYVHVNDDTNLHVFKNSLSKAIDDDIFISKIERSMFFGFIPQSDTNLEQAKKFLIFQVGVTRCSSLRKLVTVLTKWGLEMNNKKCYFPVYEAPHRIPLEHKWMDSICPLPPQERMNEKKQMCLKRCSWIQINMNYVLPYSKCKMSGINNIEIDGEMSVHKFLSSRSQIDLVLTSTVPYEKNNAIRLLPEDETIPPQLISCFDCEAYSSNDNRMPNPYIDSDCLISQCTMIYTSDTYKNWINNYRALASQKDFDEKAPVDLPDPIACVYHEYKPWQSYSVHCKIEYKPLPNGKINVPQFVLTFADELEMMESIRDLSVFIDYDESNGYNQGHFDIRFRYHRTLHCLAKKYNAVLIQSEYTKNIGIEYEEKKLEYTRKGKTYAVPLFLRNDIRYKSQIYSQALYQKSRIFWSSRFMFQCTCMSYVTFSNKSQGDNEFDLLDDCYRTELDVMFNISREIKLTSYKLDEVANKYLNQRKMDMSPQELFAAFKNQNEKEMDRVKNYCYYDVLCTAGLSAWFEMFYENAEMSKLTYASINDIVWKGQTVKILSKIAIDAHHAGYVMNCDNDYLDMSKEAINYFFDEQLKEDLLEPARKEAELKKKIVSNKKEKGYGGATVIDPTVGVYGLPRVINGMKSEDATSTLDYASLYPSIMCAKKYCPSTLMRSNRVRKIFEKYIKESKDAPSLTELVRSRLETAIDAVVLDQLWSIRDEKGKFIGYTPEGEELAKKIKRREEPKGIHVFVCKIDENKGHAFVNHIQGVTPGTLIEVNAMRKQIRDRMKDKTMDKGTYSNLNTRQNVIKKVANSVYGFSGAAVNDFALIEVAESVTAYGRQNIEATGDAITSLTMSRFITWYVHTQLNMLPDKNCYTINVPQSWQKQLKVPCKLLSGYVDKRVTIIKFDKDKGECAEQKVVKKKAVTTDRTLADFFKTKKQVDTKQVEDRPWSNIEVLTHGLLIGTIKIYGDTDSVFLLQQILKAATKRQAIEGIRKVQTLVALIMTEVMEKGIVLTMEKVIKPLILYRKKRYAGVFYEDAEKKGKLSIKGIEQKRRDVPKCFAKMSAQVLDCLLLQERIDKALMCLAKNILLIINDELCVDDYVLSKKLKEKYDNRPEHVVVAEKIKKRTQGGGPEIGERVPFVYICHSSNVVAEGAEDPEYVKHNVHLTKIDRALYLKRILGPLTILFQGSFLQPVEIFKFFCSKLKVQESKGQSILKYSNKEKEDSNIITAKQLKKLYHQAQCCFLNEEEEEEWNDIQ